MNDERNKTLEELYSNYYDSVYRFCMTVTGFDRRYYHLIEDCVQDAFIAAILKYDDFKHYNILLELDQIRSAAVCCFNHWINLSGSRYWLQSS